MKSFVLRKLYKIFHFRTIRQRLLLSYLILIIIPLGLVSAFSYSEVYRVIKGNITYSMQKSFEQSSNFLSYKLYNTYGVSNVFISNNTISDIFQKCNDPSYSFLDQVQDMYNMQQFLQSLQDGSNVVKVRLYLPDKLMYSQEGNNIFGLNEIKNTTWYQLLKKGDMASLWAPSSYLDEENHDNSNVLSLIRIIINKNNYLEKIGYVRFDFSKSSIIDLLNDATSIKNASIYIQNSLGTIIAQSGQEITDGNKVDIELIKQLAEGTNHWVQTNLGNREQMVSAKLIDNTDWYLVSVTPLDEIYNTSRAIRNNIIILVFAIGTIAYFIAYLISKSITYRLSVLSNKMKDIHNGQLIKIEAPFDSDEIDQLAQEYNFMTGEITKLINDKVKAGQEIKNAELKALQAQINPHFLYNTLDMINWYAWENDGPEIISIVDALAKFYKLSLSKGKDVVSIGDELSHVSYYFQIQSMRFKNALNLEVSVDESLMQYSILKITLQPIIENSILHGIMCKETKCGNIRISCALIENEIHIYVEDDGVGMSEEKLKSLLDPTSENSQSGGFGVRNIDQRIKLYYGTEYGLYYTSEKNKGTTCKITVPAIIYSHNPK